MVLVRRDGKWVSASLTSFTNEQELQDLLLESPYLIPGCAAAAVAKEVTIPGSGYVDLVAVNELGDVTLIECKLQSNSEIRRQVIGQILAYAAGLWKSSFDYLDQQFASRNGVPLLTGVATAAGADFNPDLCKQGVETVLATGRFRLVVAVDQITEELKRTIYFLNQGPADFSLIALELGLAREGGLDVL